ncbi:MAG: hypothetical protein V3U31_00980 [Dehalococcoidia bacterium]
MTRFRGLLLVAAGFGLAFVVMVGTVLVLINLSSRFLPAATPADRTYTPPPLAAGEPLPGRAEAHLYDIQTGPGGLSARVDATVAEALVDSLARQLAERLQKGGDASVRVAVTGVNFTPEGLYMTMGLEFQDFGVGSDQPLQGDVGMVVEDIEVLDQGYRVQVELSFGEDLVNSFLAWELPRLQEGGELPLRASSIQVSFREGKVGVVATLEVPIFGDVDVGVQARLGVREGRLEMVVEDIDLGRLSLPGLVTEQVNSYIDQGIAQLESRELPLRLQEIRLQDGRVTLRALIETE